MCLSLFQIQNLCQFWSKRPYSISILVSWCSPIMIASFKSKIWNVFCPVIFLNFRMVCFWMWSNFCLCANIWSQDFCVICNVKKNLMFWDIVIRWVRIHVKYFCLTLCAFFKSFVLIDLDLEWNFGSTV